MQITLKNFKVKIPTSVTITKKIITCSILRCYDDNNTVVTLHGYIKNTINKHSTFLQSKSSCGKEAFYFKRHDVIMCTTFWTCIKIKLLHNNYAECFRENKAIK